MPRFITLAADTPAEITPDEPFDEVAVWHTNNVSDPAYVDITGEDAVIPSDTEGEVDYTVRIVTAGARRIVRRTSGASRKPRSVSLRSAGAVRLEVEFS
jgi:hypothetical protein